MNTSKTIDTLETYHIATVGISLSDETKVIKLVGEPPHTT